MFTKHLSV